MMRPINVYDENELLPEGVTTVTIAEDQPEYQPLPCARLKSGEVLTRWKVSPEEVKQIRRAGEVYLNLLTFNHPLQPIRLSVYRPRVASESGSVTFDYSVPSEPEGELFGPDETLWAESLYGAQTRQGLVSLSIGDAERTMDVPSARAFAYSILEAAEAAETDELIMEWLAERVGLTGDLERVKVLRDLRERRRRRTSKSW